MARTAAGGFWSHFRICARTIRHCLTKSALLAALAVTGLTSPAWAVADAVKGEATFSASGGYARLVLKLAEDVNSEVTTAGSIIVIRFARPVDIAVDRLAESVPDYVSSARRDPDGSAIRLSLARRATINTMTAGERIFVDFLPDSWSGPPPSLPIEVVRELAERARAAERALRLQRAEAVAKKRPPIRVRALVQPTFVRFVFEMPDGVGVSSVLNDGKLTLAFGGTLNFDLADAKIAAPPNVASISQRVEGDSTSVDIAAGRRRRRSLLPRGQELHHRRCLPAAGQAEDASLAPGRCLACREAAGSRVDSAGGGNAGQRRRGRDHPTNVGERGAAGKDRDQARDGCNDAARAADADGGACFQARRLRADEIVGSAAETDACRHGGSTQAGSGQAGSVEARDAADRDAADGDAKTRRQDRAIQDRDIQRAAEASRPASDPPPQAKPGEEAALVGVMRDSEGLRLKFSFGTPTPAASFRRGDSVWVVFDSTKSLDVEQIRVNAGALIGDVSRLPLEKGQAIRIRLNRPQMQSLTSDERESGANWTLTFADRVLAPPQPLNVIRNIADPAHANVAVPLANPGRLHRLIDPDAGDTLLVVTAPPPIRGFIKRQDFVELSLLESAHGVAVRPNSDDIGVEVAPDKIILGRPGGLTLSSAGVAAERAATAVRPLFDIDEWKKNQEGQFVAREDALMLAIAAADPDQRPQARLDLAQFYVARGMYPEAKGETEVILADPSPKVEESVVRMVHAIASIADGPAGGGTEGSRQSRDRRKLRFAIVEGARLCRSGQMGGRAREVQERRFRHRRVAAGAADHRHLGSDARLA